MLSGQCWAAGEFVVGAGVEGDSADGIAAAVFGDLAVGDDTWLAASIARSEFEVNIRDTVSTWYGDIGLDHKFGPIGIRVGGAYWGDNNLLDSLDGRFSVYGRSESAYLSLNYEYRDFELELPPVDFFPRREARFHAHGYGLSGRVALTDSIGIHAGGIKYDYSVDLRLDTNRAIVNFLSVTRLSLINSLVDYRVNAGIGFDIGSSNLEFDVAQWEGAVAGSRTNSYSVRYLMPMGNRSDIEIGVGYDDSENYGDVTILSVYLYFYGGN